MVPSRPRATASNYSTPHTLLFTRVFYLYWYLYFVYLLILNAFTLFLLIYNLRPFSQVFFIFSFLAFSFLHFHCRTRRQVFAAVCCQRVKEPRESGWHFFPMPIISHFLFRDPRSYSSAAESQDVPRKHKMQWIWPVAKCCRPRFFVNIVFGKLPIRI